MYQILHAAVNQDFLRAFTETSRGVIMHGVASRLKRRRQRGPSRSKRKRTMNGRGSAMNDERRNDERVALSLEANWEGLSGRYQARVGDISLGGCFIDTSGSVTEGELISFEMKLPDGQWLALRGEVAFAHPHIGFSLRFSFLTEEEESALIELINS
jgi:hypothetical protein